MKNEESQTNAQNASDALALESEFRLDTTTGQWVAIVEGRGARPHNVGGTVVHTDATQDHDPHCVFCRGNELKTPAFVAAAVLKSSALDRSNVTLDDVEFIYPDEAEAFQTRPWFARSFENMYPAFRMDVADGDASTFFEVEESFLHGDPQSVPSFFNRVPGEGRHEVLIDSNRHVRSWSDLNEFEITLAFRLFRLRLSSLLASGRFAYSFIFKNVGANAGASQRHSHCQLTGNVDLPPNIRVELERLIAYERSRRARGDSRSYWDALLEAELGASVRVVAVTDRFVVYCPYASRFPGQVEICPRFDGRFEEYDDDTIDELAKLARRTTKALEEAKRRFRPNDTEPLDYNVVMRNAPSALRGELNEGEGLTRPRWAFLPSLVKKAGYEIGCGVDINPVAPETAAKLLREVF